MFAIVAHLLILAIPFVFPGMAGIQLGETVRSGDALYAMMKDPAVTDEQLNRALNQLDLTEESAHLLAHLANDPTCLERHRGQCVLELFKRHARQGMTLKDLAQLLGGARWLGESQAYRFYFVSGYIPVNGSPSSDSIFSIHVSPSVNTQAVYLTIKGKVTNQDLVNALHSKAGKELMNLQIIDVWPRSK